MIERTILATVSGAAPNERLQVALIRRADGRISIELREQHHAEGIGWFDQKGLVLDPRQFRQLQAVLNLKDAGPEMESQGADIPTVIPFPGPRSRGPMRPAAGDDVPGRGTSWFRSKT